MKSIPKEFKKHNIIFKEITRKNNVAIYSRESNNKIDEYEVIIINTVKNDWVVNGNVIIAKGSEIYPSNEQWGTFGWTTNSLDRAYEIFNRETNK